MYHNEALLHIFNIPSEQDVVQSGENPLIFFLETGRLYFYGLEGNRIIAGPSALSLPGGATARVTTDSSSRGHQLHIRPALQRQLKLFDSLSETTAILFEKVHIVPFRRETWHQATGVLAALYEDLKAQNGNDSRLIVLKMLELLTIIERETHYEIAQMETNRPLSIQELSSLIRDTYSDTFSLDDLASRCGLHPSYLSRSFKQETGMSLFAFINNVRIQKACQLLKRSGLPIIDIAFSIGYNNISFFNRYFKKITGSSPSEYRKRSQTEDPPKKSI